ncbi:hypothetical protein VSR01_01305 [Actinacidiphila sp. DG2A-62]|uniref:hypothetical protein n=1 Tax=Actinacidiphila sp. DG2A-62 TaxID=3108821 RepID=UPI002DBEA103|nr:hypothetical protein [Actinacidiphila sp. DG2A-62]MEC3992253.1 hypothetical protein [Actinacidiphila sp. DG2A-62]
MNVPQTTVTANSCVNALTPPESLRFSEHVDTETRTATCTALAADAGDQLARALAAAAAGDADEFVRYLRFAADSAVLAGRLGATDAEICGALTAARAGAAR